MESSGVSVDGVVAVSPPVVVVTDTGSVVSVDPVLVVSPVQETAMKAPAITNANLDICGALISKP